MLCFHFLLYLVMSTRHLSCMLLGGSLPIKANVLSLLFGIIVQGEPTVCSHIHLHQRSESCEHRLAELHSLAAPICPYSSNQHRGEHDDVEVSSPELPCECTARLTAFVGIWRKSYKASARLKIAKTQRMTRSSMFSSPTVFVRGKKSLRINRDRSFCARAASMSAVSTFERVYIRR